MNSLFRGIFKKPLSEIYGVFEKKFTEKSENTWYSFFKFSLVGISNTLIFFVLYYAVILIFGERYYLVGQAIGYFTGTVNSYILNSRFVFSQAKHNKFTFFKMCLCYCLIYILQTIIIFILVSRLNISEFIAPTITALITTLINFFLNKTFIFNVK